MTVDISVIDKGLIRSYIQHMRTLICLLLVSASFVSVSASAEQPAQQKTASSEYAITVIPYYSPEKLWTKFTPLLEYLKKTTGKPWELKLYPNHDATIEAICSGEVSFALLGPVPLARSIQKCSAEPAAVAVGPDGTLFYHSVIVSTDPSMTLARLKGKRIGMFKGSTAAHIVPFKMMLNAGLSRTEINPVFFEGQDSIMNGLLNGEVEAAGMKDVLFRRFSDSRLKVLKTSEPLPNFAFASAPGLNSRTKDLFLKALFRLRPKTSEADRKLMQEWDDEIKNGFVAPSRDYRSSVMDLYAAYQEVMVGR